MLKLPARKFVASFASVTLLLLFFVIVRHQYVGEYLSPSLWSGSASNPTADEPAFFPRLRLARGREADVTNTFSSYLYANDCGLSSMKLHMPIDPLCTTREKSLEAMSFGGRAGFDQPYIPYGCDFHWYTSAEICNILSRFDHVFIIGDSLQRMLTTAIYMLLRQDVGLGGIAEWEFDKRDINNPNATQSIEDCMCENQFTYHDCSRSYVRHFSDLDTSVCGATDAKRPFELSYHQWQGFPPSAAERDELITTLENPGLAVDGPLAFIAHHTFWNNVNVTDTLGWIDTLRETIASHLPELDKSDVGYISKPRFPRLFVTANNPGSLENQINFEGRDSNHIAKFERKIRPYLEERHIDMLGFYNMSLQVSVNDNIHASMRTNLLKAMMVLNWLDWVGQDEHAGTQWL